MTRYTYIGPGWYSGLPVTDFDDGDLTEDQKLILAGGVDRGVYAEAKAEVPVTPAESPAKGKQKGERDGAEDRKAE